jgi:transcriptional regulator with XRE-family HTH domain
MQDNQSSLSRNPASASSKPSGLLAFLPLCRKTLISLKHRPSEPPRTLGERLRAWRLERGLEQRDVAAMLGVRPATYGRWERDQKRPAIKVMPGVLMRLRPSPSATQKSLPEERLLLARQQLGLTQAALAEKLGVDRGTVGDWERRGRLPSEERLAAVEALLSPGGGKPG